MDSTGSEHDKWLDRITQALRAFRAAGERKAGHGAAEPRGATGNDREQTTRG